MKKFVFSLAILLSSQSLFSGEVQADHGMDELEYSARKAAIQQEIDQDIERNIQQDCILTDKKELVFSADDTIVLMNEAIKLNALTKNNGMIFQPYSGDGNSGDYRHPTLVEQLAGPAMIAVAGSFTYGAAHLMVQPYVFDGIRVGAYKMMQSSGASSSVLGAMRNRLQDQAANAASFKAALEYSGPATIFLIKLGHAVGSKGLEVLQDVSPKALEATVSVAKHPSKGSKR